MQNPLARPKRNIGILVAALIATASMFGLLYPPAPHVVALQPERATLARSGPFLDAVTDVPSCVSFLTGLGLASQDDATAACQGIAAALPAGTSFATFFGCLQTQVIGGSTPDAALSSCSTQFSASAPSSQPAAPSNPPTTSSNATCTWTGTWTRTPGNTTTVTLTQSGNQVTGDDGNGDQLSATVSGNRLTGNWTHGSDNGAIDATMNGSCTSFSGTFGGNGGGPGSSSFNATRVGGAAPAGSGTGAATGSSGSTPPGSGGSTTATPPTPSQPPSGDPSGDNCIDLFGLQICITQ